NVTATGSGSSSCAAGQDVTGVRGLDSSSVDIPSADGVQVICQSISGATPTGPTQTGAFVSPNASVSDANEQVTCPSGTVAVGLVGRSGDVLDRFTLQCGTIQAVAQVALNLPVGYTYTGAAPTIAPSVT